MPDDLADFTTGEFTHDGKTRAVYRKGEGPGVIVISEIPGITPRVADFARRVADRGCTAVMPHVFGEPGADPTVANEVGRVAWACVSREFAALALRTTSPMTVWLRALARDLHEECGGPGVGAVGMCLTGGFALAMMVDETVMAPVLSQPSMPFPLSKRHKRDLGISDEDLEVVKRRASEGVQVLGLRFTCDATSPEERFERLEEELGDAFIGVRIDSSQPNDLGIRKRAHSVLTEDLVEDDPDHPTHKALQRVLAFFDEKLGVSA